MYIQYSNVDDDIDDNDYIDNSTFYHYVDINKIQEILLNIRQ